MLTVEHDYKTLQEEVEEQRKLIRLLRNKYKDAVEEIKDLGAEANNEREYLGTALMEMNKEMGLYKSILHIAFSHDEIDRIVAKSKYNSDNKVWKVPHFLFRQSKLGFLSSTPNNMQDQRQMERNGSTLYFTQNEKIGGGDSSSLPPAAPSSGAVGRIQTGSRWNIQKSGK